ncbi:superoxide dismutase family protein [Nocardioides sp. STR2]|uniref:Superoxide dismutase family protein n=1 Tax=Nocardioides pini TaxID=2975053 RepID=A0ABT4CBB8_9ACTN|nr:superoxide dismutase family protein [Nocardioides pini]MCY4726258.1 superoxide dismutase family protein [Nocardioides pini]
MYRKRAGLAAASVLVAVPAAAMAGGVAVDHGHGPTVVHDTAYDQIRTQVHAWSSEGTTRVRLMVTGLPPGRTFGAHVHTGTCGSDPLASGGHYQHSTDPSVPLAQREVWLDVTADDEGRGVATTTVPWAFAPGSAGSVVIHALPTNAVTGAAGARLACTTVELGG